MTAVLTDDCYGGNHFTMYKCTNKHAEYVNSHKAVCQLCLHKAGKKEQSGDYDSL